MGMILRKTNRIVLPLILRQVLVVAIFVLSIATHNHHQQQYQRVTRHVEAFPVRAVPVGVAQIRRRITTSTIWNDVVLVRQRHCTFNRQRKEQWMIYKMSSGNNNNNNNNVDNKNSSHSNSDDSKSEYHATLQQPQPPPPPRDTPPPSSLEFLGQGMDAIVRLGVVLVAPPNEFHHFYRQSAIFIYAMGYDDTTTTSSSDNSDSNSTNSDTTNEENTQSSTYYIRGVILDHPTPFTIQEMIPTFASSSTSSSPDSTNSSNQQPQQHSLGSNLMFRGGDKGRENSVLLLHNQMNLPGCSEQIGTSGIYHGGFDYLLQQSSSSSTTNGATGSSNHHAPIDTTDGSNYKFFFNYCEFTELELEELFASSEDGDAWASVQIHDPSIILNEEWDRGDCWRYIRNSIQQLMKK